MAARLVELHRGNFVIGDPQAAVGRDDIDMVCFETRCPFDLRDRQAGTSREYSGEVTLDVGVEMDDHHEDSSDLVGQRLKKGLQRLNPPGGRADSDDGGSAAGRARLPLALLLLVI